MANKILKRTSFGLIRTNPRLSTNVKLVADSSDKLYLETIDSNPILSSSLYKGYEVQTDYSIDLFRFFNQGNIIPKNLLYEVYEEDGSISVKDRYKFQRDFSYCLGTYPKNSKLYPEEFAIFAPLWLERDNIPDYFVIFRMDGPVTKNINTPEYSSVNKDTDEVLDALIDNPDLFFSNYVQNARIVKQFDLTDRTNIGSYLRRHVNDPQFPESPIYFSPEEGDLSYWNGISLDEGGFTRKSEPINTDFVLPDKTIIESEDFITFGFSRNSVVCANLINMEFLFDDSEQEEYKFYRYFGLYVSEQELGKFTIDPNRLYDDRFVENTQVPTPILPNIGDPTSTNNQIQANEKGVKVYPHIVSGTTGIYSGRLLSWEETQRPRFGYVKDAIGNIYSVDNVYDWTSEYQIPGTTASGSTYTVPSFLRLKDPIVNWSAFGGFEEPFAYINTFQNGVKGVSNFSFDVLKNPSGEDQIRIKYTNPTSPKASTKITTGSTFKALVDQFTVRGSSDISAGTNDGNVYSTQGTVNQIASAIAKAINNISRIVTPNPGNFNEEIVFEAVSQGPTVVVYFKNSSEIYNNIEFNIFADVPYVEDIPYSRPSTLVDWNQESYLTSPVYISTGATFNAQKTGFVYKYRFVGGNTKPETRFVVEKQFVNNFLDQSDLTYVKTNEGYSTIKYEYSNYIDAPIYNGADIIGFTDIEKYYVLSISKRDHSLDIGSEGKTPLKKLMKNSVGYLSLMPIKDFDFDFFNEDYNKDGDASLEDLFEWEQGKGVIGNGYVVGTFGGTTSLLVTTGNAFIDENLYPITPGANSPSLRVVFVKSTTGARGMTGVLANRNEIYSTVDGGVFWNLVTSTPTYNNTDLDWLGGDNFAYTSISTTSFPPILNKFTVSANGGVGFIQNSLVLYPGLKINTITGINEDEILFAGARTYPQDPNYPKIFSYLSIVDSNNFIRPSGRWTNMGGLAISPNTPLTNMGGFGLVDSFEDYVSYTMSNNIDPTVSPNEINPFNFCQVGVAGSTGGGTAGDVPIWSCGGGSVNGYGSGAILTTELFDPGETNPETAIAGWIQNGVTSIYSFGDTVPLISPFTVENKFPVGSISFYSDNVLSTEYLLINYVECDYNSQHQQITGQFLWNPTDLETQFGNMGIPSQDIPTYGGISKIEWPYGDGWTGGTLAVDMPIHSMYIPKHTGSITPIDNKIWSAANIKDIGLIGPTGMSIDYREVTWNSGYIPGPGTTAMTGYGLPGMTGNMPGDLYLQTGYAIDAIRGTYAEATRSIYHLWRWDGNFWRWQDPTPYLGNIESTPRVYNGPVWFGTAPFYGLIGSKSDGGTLYSWDPIRGIQVLYYFDRTTNIKNPSGLLIDDPNNPGFNRLLGNCLNGPFSFNLQQYYAEPLPVVLSVQKNDAGKFSYADNIFGPTSLYGTTILGGLSIGPSSFQEDLYGVSYSGGVSGLGTVWSYSSGSPIESASSYTLHANFTLNNGGAPQSAPFQGPEGYVYGDASLGGNVGFGGLYKINPIAPTGQIWYYNFDTNTLAGITGSGEIFNFDGDSEYVSISARRGPTFMNAGNTIVALANYSTPLIGTIGSSAGPWVYGSRFIGSTTLSTWYQPMGPTVNNPGSTDGGYFQSFNRVKNFPWLGSTAQPDYYIVSGQPYSIGGSAIMVSRGITGFSTITDYGVIKPLSIGGTVTNSPAYSTFAFENDFGLLSLWTVADGAKLLSSVIGTTALYVSWGSIDLPGATNTPVSAPRDLEVYPVEIPVTNPFVQWWALSDESKNNIINAIGSDSQFNLTGGFQRLESLYNEFDDTADSIANEYDRLRENDNPILSVYSRVVPFINKWVYDNESTDVRENGYRLNVDQAFGMFNFSPSFSEYSRNSKLFTHEWYYLQEYPEYMTFNQKLRSFSYFDEVIVNPTGSTGDYINFTGLTGASGGGLFSVIDDYFVQYFTRETIDGYPIPREFRYSIFNGGNDIKFAEALFRGAKVAIKDRSGFTELNYNVEEIQTIPSAIYDDYKFSAVLTYGESTAIKVIKNDKWKAITVLIEAELSDPLLRNYEGGRWIDRAYLYSANDLYSYEGYGGDFQFADVIIKGSINGWVDTGEFFEIFTGIDINGELPDFTNDITINPGGGYNSIYISNTVGSITYLYKFNGIFDITSDSFKCASIEGLPLNPTLTPTGFNSYVNIRNAWPSSQRTEFAKALVPQTGSRIYYEFGGYRAYDNILTSISFASIADAINSGDPHVQYIQVNTDGTVDFNTFLISLLPPDDLVKATYLDVVRSEDKPSGLQSSIDIGFDLVGAPRASLSSMYRYRGEYTPKWYDIIKFVDENDLKEEGLEYLNINIWDVQRGGSGSTESPYFYWKDENLGIIPNLYLYKVNVENPNIVGQNITGSTRNIYPAIGEISIDYKDFFIFRSSWDPYYYWKYLKRNISQPAIGTREPKEERAFFASKVISIPDSPIIETFDGGSISSIELGGRRRNANVIKTIPQDVVFTIEPISGSSQRRLTADFYVTGALTKWLIANGFGAEFEKYIDPNYSFDSRSIEDDIRVYIEENIFDRYEITNIKFWEKVYPTNTNEPILILDLTDQEKIDNGFVTSSNFQTIPLNNNPLNFSLIYNLPTDRSISIACTVTLNKK